MRFTDLSMPKCAYWLEKLNVLLLVDPEKRIVPFINSKITTTRIEPNSLDSLIRLIYPEDRQDFERLLLGINEGHRNNSMRLITHNDSTIHFTLSSIHIGASTPRRMLVGLPGGGIGI